MLLRFYLVLPRSPHEKRPFVCTGNICRSPMAQGLFADLVRGRRDIEVTSAGIGAVGGQPPSPHSVEVMSELGMDIRNIRSKPLMAELVRKADFIFVMTYGHLDSMLTPSFHPRRRRLFSCENLRPIFP